nr:polymorphic toxin type 50 domain-containing protein [Rosenbergiella epipactidis]
MVALPTGLGGGILAAATPEIAAAAKAAIQACAGNVVLCLNNAGIQVSEAIVPGGVGAGGAVGIGKTAAEATAAKAEVVAANAAKGSGSASKITINQGQQNKHIPGSNEYKIATDAGLNKSVLTVQPETLLPKLGTGQQVGKTSIGAPGSKERINYGEIIGNYIDPQTGVSTPTTNGIVHYGKNGVHIVPARPSE